MVTVTYSINGIEFKASGATAWEAIRKDFDNYFPYIFEQDEIKILSIEGVEDCK